MLTPTRSQNVRMAFAGKPRRRSPASVGMRGSSQPSTTPRSTISRSLRLLSTMYVSASFANSICWGGDSIPSASRNQS